MKRFFLKIWAWIKAFFTWLFSSACLRALRGKEAGRKEPNVPEVQATGRDWFKDVEYLMLYVFERNYSLVLVLSRTGVDRAALRDTQIVVVPKGRGFGIECTVDRRKEIRVYGTKYILPLSPVTVFDTHSFAKRIVWGKNHAQNVVRVTLRLGDRSMTFLPKPEGEVYAFYPGKTAA